MGIVNYINNIWNTFHIYFSDILSYVFPPKNNYIRCIHNQDMDVHYNDLLNIYNSCCEHYNNNERIMIGNTENPINLGTGNITIEIPMIFHLLDPNLFTHDINYWKNHINKYIITQLDNDYNVSYFSYSSQYIENVNKLFVDADPSKKKFYLDLVSTLPKKLNLQWKFVLKNIIMKPVTNLNIVSGKNDIIFKSTIVEDPENFLNIVIVPSKQVLGISVFPFTDRYVCDSSKIDPNFRYRNAILINTKIFEGNTYPFDKYRTFTHEIGHWCGLLHPFDNVTFKTSDLTKFGINKLIFDKTSINNEKDNKNFVGDLIADTAPQYKPTYGTVYDKVNLVTKKISTSVQTIKIRNTPYAYIFEKNNETPNFYNFMDYTDDNQMCMFTHLQILHMIYMLSRFRPNFIKQD